MISQISNRMHDAGELGGMKTCSKRLAMTVRKSHRLLNASRNCRIGASSHHTNDNQKQSCVSYGYVYVANIQPKTGILTDEEVLP